MRFIAGTLLALAVATSSAMAQQPAPPVAPNPTEQVAAFASDPLNTSATYAFILDGDTGLPLYSKRGDESMVPASMSKLMLFYIVFERIRDGRLKLTDEFTVSEHAWRILALWDEMRQRFVKVFPNDYRRVVEKQKRFKEAGLSEEEAAMAAFEENAHDLARAGGK